jgi:hypothetical protein
LTKWLQQSVFVEVEKQIVIVIELRAKRPIKKLYLRILEERQGWRDGNRGSGIAPCGDRALHERRSGNSSDEL